MDRLNTWLTLTANFGVLIGIGFLAYEVNVNTNSLNGATAAQMVTNWNETMLTTLSTPELSNAMRQATGQGVEELDERKSSLVRGLAAWREPPVLRRLHHVYRHPSGRNLPRTGLP